MMWTQTRILAVALCLTLLAGCAQSRFLTAPESRPKILQCSSDALAACQPLIADDGNDCGAALKADAINRGRHIECQLIQRAAVQCLLNIEAAGLLTRDPKKAAGVKP